MKMNQLNKEGKLDKGYYKDGKRHGYWEYYFFNEELSYKGNFKNGERHGYWEHYYVSRFVKVFYI